MRPVLLTGKYVRRIEKKLTEYSYVEIMKALTARAVKRIKRRVPSSSEFHVIASVEDFEILALPVVAELERLGHGAVWSCLWPDRRSIGVDRSTTIAPIVVSVDEAPLDPTKHLILVSSCADTAAVLESMLIHAHSTPDFSYTGISVIAPFFGDGMRQGFKQALPRRYAETNNWLGLFQVSPGEALRLKQLFTRETAAALGVEDPEALRRHMPVEILRRFDDTPKTTPGLSMK